MTNQEWKELIAAKREEIKKAIAEATEKALETGERFTITLNWYGEVEINEEFGHGMFDFGITSNDLIEVAVIDFETELCESTKYFETDLRESTK